MPLRGRPSHNLLSHRIVCNAPGSSGARVMIRTWSRQLYICNRALGERWDWISLSEWAPFFSKLMKGPSK